MTILIADDHVIFREGLAALLPQLVSVKQVLQASTGIEAVELIRCNQVDLVLMDIEMPVMNGIDATREIKKQKYSSASIIALTMFNRYNDVLHLYDSGIDGYLLKDSTAKEVTKAINMVKEGKEYYCPAVQEVLYKALMAREKQVNPESGVSLTEREKEIVKCICQQYSTEEIAEKLFISPLTVNNHRRSILAKTKSKNVAGIIVYALVQGIYRLPL